MSDIIIELYERRGEEKRKEMNEFLINSIRNFRMTFIMLMGQ